MKKEQEQEIDIYSGLRQAIEDAKSDLEEANEGGDLEERMETSHQLHYLQNLLIEKEQSGEKARWIECSLCDGTGNIKDYEDNWPCVHCKGTGGKWV